MAIVCVTNGKFQVGQRIDRWTIIGNRFQIRIFGRSRPMFVCECQCGTVAAVLESTIGKQSKSCGCLKAEVSKRERRKSASHEFVGTPEYNSWSMAKDRCSNPNNINFARYGGRGICMCAEWVKSIAAFVRDMGPRPSLSHTLDRINNDGNYEPGNCRWATKKQQMRNRQNTIKLTVDGETRPLSDWIEETGLNYATAYARLKTGRVEPSAVIRLRRTNGNS